MDIFIIKTSDVENFSDDILATFQKKNISNRKRWLEHCFSYLVLNKILNNIFDIKNADIEFINNKPFLKSREKYFSISHSNEYMTISISDFDCGVDIEEIKSRNYIQISKRMGFTSKSINDFYSNWTIYEAKYKLGKKPASSEIFDFNNYKIAAVSENIEEKFKIYIKNINNFSK